MASFQSLGDENAMPFLTNPYSSRTPITNPAQFYGRDHDIRRVAASIQSWQPCAIFGEPRIGKTSLLYYLIHPDGARSDNDFLQYIGNLSDYLFVLVELQRLPVRNALGFWRYLLDRLTEEARQAGAETPAMREEYASSQEPESDSYQVQTSFESYMKQMRKKTVFFFDDFDIVIKDFEPGDVGQVTDKLRTLKEALDLNEWLNYIIMSTDALVSLLKAKGITNPSPLISILSSMQPLGLLEQEACDDLLHEPLLHSRQQFTDDDIAFVYKQAGRHPDFMKITCSYLLEARRRSHVNYTSIRQQVEDDSRIRWLMNALWERIKRGGSPLSEILLQVAQGQQVSATSSAFSELCQRGFIDDSGTQPRIFGDLFRAFILRLSSRTTMPVEGLTPLESKLYTYLAKHMGQTCSRKELQKAIWGDKVPSSHDALEQLVRRVRGKIEPDINRPLHLLNVRGQGYLLRNDPTASL
jgi:hypothetical protein